MISFVIPAHNEEACLGRTLEAIHASARAVGRDYEIIVANDASTDGTAEVARQHGATVVDVHNRQIAATRNSGARAAHGEYLFFVDADTVINSKALAGALRCLDKGAVGGGASVWFDGHLPLYIRVLELFMGVFSVFGGFCGGAFLFCKKAAFEAVGGFDERLFCSEECFLTVALQRQGRFVVLWHRVLTSGRRVRTTSGLQILALLARVVLAPVKTITRRAAVEKIWYNSDRQKDDILPGTLVVRISNGVALVLTLLIVTGPVWGFIPWSWTPLGGAPGKIRFVIAAFLVHVGLILWPISLFVAASLWASFKQKRWWMSAIKLGAVLAFCIWQAWDSTMGAIWIWRVLYHWVILA